MASGQGKASPVVPFFCTLNLAAQHFQASITNCWYQLLVPTVGTNSVSIVSTNSKTFTSDTNPFPRPLCVRALCLPCVCNVFRMLTTCQVACGSAARRVGTLQTTATTMTTICERATRVVLSCDNPMSPSSLQACLRNLVLVFLVFTRVFVLHSF